MNIYCDHLIMDFYLRMTLNQFNSDQPWGIPNMQAFSSVVNINLLFIRKNKLPLCLI